MQRAVLMHAAYACSRMHVVMLHAAVGERRQLCVRALLLHAAGDVGCATHGHAARHGRASSAQAAVGVHACMHAFSSGCSNQHYACKPLQPGVRHAFVWQGSRVG